MSSAVRYWLETAPEMEMLPAGMPSAFTRTGGHPVPIVHSASTPSCTSPSTRSAMGLSRMRSTPSRMNSPLPAAATAAVSGRMAVPAFPRNRVAPAEGNLPPQPDTVIFEFSQSSSRVSPSSLSAPTMYRMSSESCKGADVRFACGSSQTQLHWSTQERGSSTCP
jgi:hypothetical protein